MVVYLLTVDSVSWSVPANKSMPIVWYQEMHLVDCIVIYCLFPPNFLNQFPEYNGYTAKGVVYFSSCIAFSHHVCLPSKTTALAKCILNSVSVNIVNIKQLFWGVLIKYINSMKSVHESLHCPLLFCCAYSCSADLQSIAVVQWRRELKKSFWLVPSDPL